MYTTFTYIHTDTIFYIYTSRCASSLRSGLHIELLEFLWVEFQHNFCLVQFLLSRLDICRQNWMPLLGEQSFIYTDSTIKWKCGRIKREFCQFFFFFHNTRNMDSHNHTKQTLTRPTVDRRNFSMIHLPHCVTSLQWKAGKFRRKAHAYLFSPFQRSRGLVNHIACFF